MNRTKNIALAILLTFIISSSFSLTLFTAPRSSATDSYYDFSEAPEIPLPSPEPAHRILPLSILVYTEYVDDAPGGEYEHTMTAIDNYYGTDYYATNLTDYTNLDSHLPGQDVFLIPEQELVNDQPTMKAVGQAWASILPGFIDNGGVIILMSYGSYGGTGTTSYIYNETGLMEIYGFTPVAFTTINLVNASDALARDVSSSWTAPNGAISFDSPELTSVVEDGSEPVVIHKIMGQGHIVLLGFDLFVNEPNCDTILANAIRLHRHVIFDNSHGQYEDIFGAYSTFVSDLTSDNFAVSTINYFDTNAIMAAEVFVVPYCTTYFTGPEKAFLENYVLQGGGLFLLADWGPYGEAVGDLAQLFGYGFDNSYTIISDTDDNEAPFNDPNQPYYSSTNIRNHSLTIDVTTIQMFYGTAILTLPANAYSVINTDTDGTAQWVNGTAAGGLSVYAASTFGMGRVVVSGDCNFLEDDADYDADGTMDYNEHSHEDLLPNTVRWLSAAGLVERKVLFDSSHNPYLSFSSYTLFAKYLTSNGYTVQWMTTFYPDLMRYAHVLVVPAGSTAYSPAENVTIRDFVDNGGGIMLVADWTYFGDSILPIAQWFGMSHNSTHAYLSDSDDGIGIGFSGITYEGANILPHPITNGVNRIYVDRGTGLINLGGGTTLVRTDNDGTSEWFNGTDYVGPAGNVPVFAANTFGLGHIVYLTDLNFLDTFTYIADDNNLFLVNAFEWLSQNQAPIVSLTYPNGGEVVNNTITISWTAFDPNHDPIVGYDLLYSNDSGSSWYPIVTGIMGTSFVWNTTVVPNGDNYLIRIAAFDYELVGIDDSDAVFSIDNPLPPPPLPPLPWWWWIVVLIVAIIIVIVILVYLFIRRRGAKAD